mmetsp:Transcript_8595/g.13911  ORF Transcript_8595/g.13911 Transcript_8595/m.13911 type:complete len:150 (+) Transcript_8595:348-797(+)
MMDVAIEEAKEGVERGEGGPFGAVIVDANGKIIARAHNMVLQSNDPTAHAEMEVIRKASARLGKFDLSGCKIYTTCEPCPMCFGAIHWAKIQHCIYSATGQDAANAGFDNENILNAICQQVKQEDEKCVMTNIKHQPSIDVMKMEYDLY